MQLTDRQKRKLYNLTQYKTGTFTYDSLIIENTNRCTAKCAICYQAAGGEKNNDKLDINVAKKCIRDAAKLDYVGKRFHLAGGESFIFMDDCKELFSCAKKSGYEKISCTTNAFWCKSYDKAMRTCETMRKSGLNLMEISWDYWHYQFITPEAINNCIRACHENEIQSNLRLLATKNHKMHEVMDLLDPAAIELINEISSSQVSSVGRAIEGVCDNDFYISPAGIDGTCERSLCLSVNAKGIVAPCCSGFDQCVEYPTGNIYNESIRTIAERMNSDPILRKLIYMGAYSFMPILKECGIKVSEKLSSPCHLCVQIFSKRENYEAIKECIDKKNIETLKKILAKLAG